jgi:hypothetical protein
MKINCVGSMTTFSSFILFYNVNNNSKKFHNLQIYSNSHIHLTKPWSYVEFTLFCNGFTFRTTYELKKNKELPTLAWAGKGRARGELDRCIMHRVHTSHSDTQLKFEPSA